MATDIDLEYTINDSVNDSADDAGARAARTPNAVWINKPADERGSVDILRAAKALIGAGIVVALLALAATMSRDKPLLSEALAGTGAEQPGMTGNGPTGYFPDRFERGGGAMEQLPPTF